MVNRQDLGITVRDKPHSLYRGYVDSGTGKCKIVRGKKNFI